MHVWQYKAKRRSLFWWCTPLFQWFMPLVTITVYATLFYCCIAYPLSLLLDKKEYAWLFPSRFVEVSHYGTIGLSLGCLFLVMEMIGKEFYGVTTKTPLSAFPIGFVLICLGAAGATVYVLLHPLIPLIVCIMEGVILLGTLFLLRMERAMVAYKTAQAKSAPVLKARILTPPKCEICQKESAYDLCLECEVQHRVERHRVRAQNLRAKQAGTPATLTLPEWLAIIEGFHRLCAYCQTGPYEVLEHYVPITHGGGTTADNCVPACKSCNAKKSGKHPEN